MCVVFFKQKTAYEMRISDWSSDVCSSDLPRDARGLEILAAIFNDRLFDRLRPEQGASYGPVVDSHWPTGFDSGGYLLGRRLPAPNDLDRFYAIAREVVAVLGTKPVGADNLARNPGPYRPQEHTKAC